jgi:hypothetical protein
MCITKEVSNLRLMNLEINWIPNRNRQSILNKQVYVWTADMQNSSCFCVNIHQTKHNNGALLIKLLLDRWNMKQWSTARREEKASSKIKIKNTKKRSLRVNQGS